MSIRGYRYKLCPSPAQQASMQQYAGVTRLVYNLALEQRETWGRRHRINAASQCREVTQLRSEFEWVRAASVTCAHQAIRDLDVAFHRFFSGKSGFPTPRKKGVNDSFRFLGREVSTRRLNGKWSAVSLPKLGWIKFRDTRAMRGEVRNATVRLEAGQWFISILCREDHHPPQPMDGVVGIDRGIATTLALSTGEMLSMPDSLKSSEKAKRKAQRTVSRRRKGSKRRARALRRVARIMARQARIRRDFHHRAALDISKRFGVAVLEDLKTKQMTATARGTIAEPGRGVRQKAGLNRAILNAGWHQFATILTYKMEERGGQVVIVPARFTSQTCAACNVVDARSRESQARFVCISCGHTDHADINAAVNIERRGSTPLLGVEGSRQRPVEASTSGFPETFDFGRRGC